MISEYAYSEKSFAMPDLAIPMNRPGANGSGQDRIGGLVRGRGRSLRASCGFLALDRLDVAIARCRVVVGQVGTVAEQLFAQGAGLVGGWIDATALQFVDGPGLAAVDETVKDTQFQACRGGATSFRW